MPQLLTVERTDNMIELPSKLILTADGCHVFRQMGRPLKRLKREDGSIGDGLEAPSFNAQTVQKFVMNGYMEEIYVSVPQLLASRSHIIDATKLVTFGVLYKKMNPALANMLINSQVLQLYNRKNASAPIQDLNAINKEQSKLLKRSKAKMFEVMELEIRDAAVQHIITDQELEEEDRLLQIRSLDKFISFIDERIWYLYFIVYQTPLKDNIRALFAELIASYINRTKIATHLANIVMELAQNAEKAHFEKLLIDNGIVPNADEVYRYLKKADNRRMVVDLARRHGQNLNIAWAFDSGKASTNREYRVEILITNKGSIGNLLEQKLRQKTDTQVKDVDLSEFFQDTGQNLGAGLGLLYISYLKEECKKARVQFNSQIYGNKNDNTTTAKLQAVF